MSELPFPISGYSVRECSLCPLRTAPGNHGPVWADVSPPPNGKGLGDVEFPFGGLLGVIVGEAPGEEEDKLGRPFVGKSGVELRERLLTQVARVFPESFAITNVVKCRPPKNRTPKQSECDICAGAYLGAELGAMLPRYIIACGLTAARYFLGGEITMEQVHGIGYRVNPLESIPDYTPIVIPAYHPAAGFRDGKRMAQCVSDFHAIGEIIRSQGRIGVGVVRDPWAGHEDYSEWYTPEDFGDTLVAVDTETRGDGSLLSVQFSTGPGMGRLIYDYETEKLRILGGVLARPDTQTIIQNALFDLPQLERVGIYPSHVVDTMVMAYLVQDQPQGLKALAYRLCGMAMQDYEDLVAPYSYNTVMEWLLEQDLLWDDAKQYTRDNPVGKLIRGLQRLWGDMTGDNAARGKLDPLGRLRGLDDRLEGLLTELCGPPPVPGLEVVPYTEFLWYSCRDPDATLRVYPILMGMVGRYK